MDKALKNIKAGLYTHIFISLELTSILNFRSLLKKPKFKKQLALVIINKAYLVI